MSDLTTAAVIVTHNRKELLRECLLAVRNQTRRCDIILVDNACTDGTETLPTELGLNQETGFHYLRLETNTGGAGGFCEGIKAACIAGYARFWLMDDDTIPRTDALEKLENDYELVPEAPWICSKVVSVSGHCMNLPVLYMNSRKGSYPEWPKYIDKGLVQVESATFVSLLLNRDSVIRCGLPITEYFIWGDDTEYTLRLTRTLGPGYLSGSSQAVHKREIEKQLSLQTEIATRRIPLYFYFYRNALHNSRLYRSPREHNRFCIHVLATGLRILFGKSSIKIQKTTVLLSAIISYMFDRKLRQKLKSRYVWKTEGEPE